MSEFDRLLGVNANLDIPPAVVARLASSQPIKDAIRNGASNKLDTLEQSFNVSKAETSSTLSGIDRRLNSVESIVNVKETQVLEPSGGSVTYALQDLPVQGVLVKIPKSGITEITHPSNVTWFGGKNPSLVLASNSIVMLGFVQVSKSSYIGYVIYGQDPTIDILKNVSLKNYRASNALSNWLRGGIEYLGVYAYSKGSLDSGFTTENNVIIQGVISQRYRNQTDLAPYISEATPDDVRVAGTKSTPSSLKLNGAKFDKNQMVVSQATFVTGSRPILRIAGDIYNQTIAEIVTDASGKYTTGYTGSVEGSLSVYGGTVPYQAGDTLRLIITDGTFYSQLKRSDGDKWITLYSGNIKNAPNDAACAIIVGSHGSQSQKITGTKAFGVLV